MRRTLQLLAVAVWSATAVWGQGIKKDDFVRDDAGAAIAGAEVQVCRTDTMCDQLAHLVTIYSDRGLTTLKTNPTMTDSSGYYFFYAPPGRYNIRITVGITSRLFPDVVLGNDPAGNLVVGGPSPWFDVTNVVHAGGASGSAQNTTGSITSNSTTLTLAAAQDFKNGQGVAVAGAGPLPTISTPASLTVTAQGTPGMTIYSYRVATIDTTGGISAPTAATTITNGNATLGSTNYNQLTWTAVANAAMYVVYGRSGTLTYIGIARVQTDGGATAAWNDYGVTTLPAPWFLPTGLPTTATAQILTTKISAGGGSTSLTLATSATTTVTNAKVQHDETAAIQAAINAATVAGGTVYLPPLPANGQYNFGNLDLSQLGNNTPPNQGWVVLLAGGPLAPYMPIIFNRGLHALIGVQQSTENPSFHRKPFTKIKAPGINPVIRVTGAGVPAGPTPVRIETIGITEASGDGIVVDTGVSWFFMDGVSLQHPSDSTGSPLVIDMRASNGGKGGGFGYYIRNSGFAQTSPNTAAQPSVNFIGGVGSVHLDEVYIGGRGIAFSGTSTNNTSCTGSFRNVQIESLLDPAYITISGNQQCRSLLLDNFQGADYTITPTALFSVTAPAALYTPTINGGDGYNVLFTGTGAVSGVNVWDLGAISTLRISTGTVPDRLTYGDVNRQQWNGQSYFGPSTNHYSLNMLVGYPTGVGAALTPGGSLTVGTTYYYVVTALDSLGNETGRSPEASVTPTTGNQTAAVSWTAPASGGAVSYRVYRGTVSGGQSVYFTAAGSPFSDTGGAGTAGSPPTETSGFATILRFDGASAGPWWLNPPTNMGFGTQAPGVKWDFKGAMRTDTQFTSTLATGTAPLSVASTTPVANLTVQRADSLTLLTSVNANGSGLKHGSAPTGSIAAGARAEVTLAWPAAFADANYNVTCDVQDSATLGTALGLVQERLRQITAAQVSVVVFNPTAGALTGTVLCTAVHP